MLCKLGKKFLRGLSWIIIAISINFTAIEWLDEISARRRFADILINPGNFSEHLFDLEDLSVEAEEAIGFFNFFIKQRPLVSMKFDLNNSRVEEIIESFKNIKISESEYKLKFSSVRELSEYHAYSFFLYSDKKTEIENDYSFSSYSTNFQEWAKEFKRRLEVETKYSQPIANLDLYEGNKFLEIDLHASDEQILNEFKNWLVDTRNSSDKFIKRQFSTKDFQDWSESQLLPYWDLTMIAAIENATIPYHAIGNALFPDEFGVDLTERIRKITKRKCQFIFSKEVINALSAQVEAEYVQRNNLL